MWALFKIGFVLGALMSMKEDVDDTVEEAKRRKRKWKRKRRY